jgi:hypothetical protein
MEYFAHVTVGYKKPPYRGAGSGRFFFQREHVQT